LAQAEEEYFNVPSVKYQPHGHLLLATEEDMAKLSAAHQVQKAVGAQTALISKVIIDSVFPAGQSFRFGYTSIGTFSAGAGTIVPGPDTGHG
jgi:hypothetical protein